MVPLLTPETVVARLESNQQQLLLAKDDPPSLAMAETIKTELVASAIGVSPARRQALLAESVNAISGRELTDFSVLGQLADDFATLNWPLSIV
jgi:hypothetical protein